MITKWYLVGLLLVVGSANTLQTVTKPAPITSLETMQKATLVAITGPAQSPKWIQANITWELEQQRLAQEAAIREEKKIVEEARIRELERIAREQAQAKEVQKNSQQKRYTTSEEVETIKALVESTWPGQWSCMDKLISKESGWKVNARNSSSGAFGLPQALPGSKMASAGADWETNPVTQVKWMINYIYWSKKFWNGEEKGNACSAWNHSQSKGWY